MKKNKFFSIIFYFLFISLVLLLSFSPKRVYAAENKENKLDKDFYCSLCRHTDPSDPLYEKERQFYYKVKSIKEKYGNSIDEVALIASVLHKYSNNELAYKANFDSDFDSNNYNNNLDIIKKLYLNDESLSASDFSSIVENEKLDLLTIASIVMVDSNHGKTYSDVCFKKALAGDRLIGNDRDDESYFNKMVSSILNKAVCESVKRDRQKYSNSSKSVSLNSEAQRINNIDSVCQNGYIGGLYPEVSKIKDEKLKQDVKDNNANSIIDLANYYKRLYGSGVEEYGDSCSADIAGTTGEFASWRQFDPRWGEIPLGDSDLNVKSAGCLVTSISMQIARSGTKIGSLPSGYSEFNPGAFVTSSNEHDGFSGGGNYAWTGYSTISPNWGVGDFVSLNESSNLKLAEAVSNELSSGFGPEQYQKFLVLQIHHSTSAQHWVAVNGVENGVVTIFDPARDGTTLDANYDNWVVDGYRVMYAKDVPNGQMGNTNNNGCSGDAGEGEIQIPSEYGNGGFTVTEIDKFNWVDPSRDLFDKWMADGGKYDDGIAIYQGRYLIACTETFGVVGDSIDFYLEDGTKIPGIIFDSKDPNDPDCNKWGHGDGANVLEFEVSSEVFRSYGDNPGNNGWHMEWAGKRVASATNLGGGVAPVNNGEKASSSKGAYCKNGVAYGVKSSGKNGDIAKLAVALAATASPDSQLHAPGSAGSRLNDSRLSDFFEVMDETIHKYPCHDPNNPNSHGCGYNNYAYASCVQAAAGVIRATADPDIDSSAPYGFDKYLTENTEKWTLVEELNPSDILDEHCQPGDVLVSATCEKCAGHAAIYVGNKLARVKFPETNGNVFEANYSSAGYPYINYYNTSGYKFKVFRPTGKGTFTYPFIDISKYLDKYNW